MKTVAVVEDDTDDNVDVDDDDGDDILKKALNLTRKSMALHMTYRS